jgi:hypothetical protein
MKRFLSSLLCSATFLSTAVFAQAAPATSNSQQTDAYIAQQTGPIFECTAPRAPAGWKNIILQLVKKDNGFVLFTTALMSDNSVRQFATCDINAVAQNIYNLNTVLPAEQQNWKVLMLQVSPNRAVMFSALTQEDVVRINSGKLTK